MVPLSIDAITEMSPNEGGLVKQVIPDLDPGTPVEVDQANKGCMTSQAE